MLILFVVVWPLLLALLLVREAWTLRTVRWTLPLAALPAFVLALTGDATSRVSLPWLILGSHFGLGGGGPVFLLLTALLWTLAGWYAPGYLGADPRLRRYAFFHLLTLTGNIGLVLAEDVPGFYATFALMTFASYGLVIHSGSDAARRAGRIYLAVAIVGEALLLAALFLATDAADSWLLQDLGAAVATSPHHHTIIALALFGFGVKAGLLPVHFWLPLAHPVAPTPASAVLSGAMIKAGLLGWMHVLPLGHGDFSGWGLTVILLGLLAAFYGVVCGLAQSEPKANLAYSSISQMGIMTVGIGAGLCDAQAWPAIATAVTLYALNHALAKGSLFLGTGVSTACRGASLARRRVVLAGLSLAALVIAGAPLLGGALTKNALKYPVSSAAEGIVPGLGLLLSLSAVATTLLLGRFLLLIAADMRSSAPHHVGRSVWLAWFAGLIATAVGAAWAISFYQLEVRVSTFQLSSIWSALWPILVGVSLLWLDARRTRGKSEQSQGRFPAALIIPPGDIVVALERATVASRRVYGRLPGESFWHLNLVPYVERIAKSRPVQDFFNQVEIQLKRWETAGMMLLLLLLFFWLALG